MKLMIGVGALILLFSIPARAQSYGANVGGGSSLNSGGGLNAGGGLRGVTFHSLQSSPVATFHMTVTTGSDGDFIPSTYLPFAQAVELGKELQAAKPKTLAEVALEYRNEKKAKAELLHNLDSTSQTPQKRDQ
jgi:hypothetical protein